jgi:hypothetical protein
MPWRKEKECGAIHSIKAPRQQNGPARHLKQFMMRCHDACPLCQTQCNFFPSLDTVFISLLGKLGNGKTAVLIDDRGFWARPAQRGSWGENQLQIVIRFLVAQNALRALEQTPEINKRRNPARGLCQKNLLANAAKA